MTPADCNEQVLTPALALLPVLKPDARSSNGTPLFLNPCPDCGVQRLGDRRKLGKPCAPCAMKRRATHGLSDHPLYRVLKNIEARCRYPSASNWAYYGGRGIRVCREWLDHPERFVRWALRNGWRPGLEIDRINNDGNYSPDNCQILNHAKNSRKRRNARCNEQQAHIVKASLKRGASVRQAARDAGVPYMSAWHIANGNTWKDVA